MASQNSAAAGQKFFEAKAGKPRDMFDPKKESGFYPPEGEEMQLPVTNEIADEITAEQAELTDAIRKAALTTEEKLWNQEVDIRVDSIKCKGGSR